MLSVPIQNVTMISASQYTHDVEGLTTYSEYVITLTALNEGASSPNATIMVNTSIAGMIAI